MESIKRFWNSIYYILWKIDVKIDIKLSQCFHWLIPKCCNKWKENHKRWMDTYMRDAINYSPTQLGMCIIHGNNSLLLVFVVLAVIRGFHLPQLWVIAITFITMVLTWQLSEKLIYPTKQRKKFYKQCDAKPKTWKVTYTTITCLLFITFFVLMGVVGIMLGMCLIDK